MRSVKKTALTVLLLTASLTLGACKASGSSNEGQTKGAAQTQGQAGADEARTEAAQAGEPVTINYYGRPDDNGVETTIVAAFEEAHPSIKVNYVELPDSSNDRLKTINTVLQAGDSSIDVFAGDVVWPPIFSSAGWVVALDDYLEEGELDAYLPGPLSAFQLNGKTWGLPFMADAGALYYRKDLLEKYNKPVPKTWAELAETGKEIAEAEGNMSGFVSYWMQNESLTSSMLEFYWEKGGEVVDESGSSVLDEAKLAETLAEMKAMIDNKVAAAGIETFNTAASRAVVTAGGAVFTRDWLSGYAPFNAEGSAVAGNMEIAPLPSYGSLGGWGVMVSAFSKNQNEAIEFAKFRANYESQMIACDLVDIKPTLKAAYEDEELLSKKPELPNYLPVLEASKPRPLSPYYAEISGVMQLEIHSVITGLATPEDGAANIVQKVAQILQ